jgi:hypothetical protein
MNNSNENPVMEDLEVSEDIDNINSSDSKNNPIADIGQALETILSEEHFDQKTNITNENETGLIQIDVLQAHMLKSFGYEYPSLVALKDSKQQHAVSVNGYRSDQIVDIFKSLQTTVISGDNLSGNTGIRQRLLGK